MVDVMSGAGEEGEWWMKDEYKIRLKRRFKIQMVDSLQFKKLIAWTLPQEVERKHKSKMCIRFFLVSCFCLFLYNCFLVQDQTKDRSKDSSTDQTALMDKHRIWFCCPLKPVGFIMWSNFTKNTTQNYTYIIALCDAFIAEVWLYCISFLGFSCIWKALFFLVWISCGLTFPFSFVFVFDFSPQKRGYKIMDGWIFVFYLN